MKPNEAPPLFTDRGTLSAAKFIYCLGRAVCRQFEVFCDCATSGRAEGQYDAARADREAEWGGGSVNKVVMGGKAAGRGASMIERGGCISRDQYWADWEKTAVSPAKNKRGE